MKTCCIYTLKTLAALTLLAGTLGIFALNFAYITGDATDRKDMAHALNMNFQPQVLSASGKIAATEPKLEPEPTHSRAPASIEHEEPSVEAVSSVQASAMARE